jgi:hypothetical protein
MINRRTFLSACASALTLLATWRPGWAQTTNTANVTFILFNDFYLMGEQPFPDGKPSAPRRLPKGAPSSWRMAATRFRPR